MMAYFVLLVEGLLHRERGFTARHSRSDLPSGPLLLVLLLMIL